MSEREPLMWTDEDIEQSVHNHRTTVHVSDEFNVVRYRDTIKLMRQVRDDLLTRLQEAERQRDEAIAEAEGWEDAPDDFYTEVTNPNGRTELEVIGDTLFLKYSEFDTGFDCKLHYDLGTTLRLQRRKATTEGA